MQIYARSYADLTVGSVQIAPWRGRMDKAGREYIALFVFCCQIFDHWDGWLSDIKGLKLAKTCTQLFVCYSIRQSCSSTWGAGSCQSFCRNECTAVKITPGHDRVDIISIIKSSWFLYLLLQTGLSTSVISTIPEHMTVSYNLSNVTSKWRN